MFTVIAFDISDDRARYRAVKLLRRYAVRVQKSVFEAANLPPNHYQRLREQLEAIVDLRTDRVRYYFLCGSCIKRVEWSGSGSLAEHREYEVI
jgi:CRISPR-associated protein Cas2